MYMAFYLGDKSENPSATRLDRFICWATNSGYSHVELITEFDVSTLRGTAWSSSPRDGGIRPATIDFSTGHWDIIEIDIDLTDHHVHQWFMERIDARYDWLGAIGAHVPIMYRDNHRWFCSEAVGACMGIPDSYTMTPGELHHYVCCNYTTTLVLDGVKHTKSDM